ncbi:MAG: TolC family protein, partial [Alistipes sp.]|nr:TolC family protein [Alistipes sp.]
VMRIISLLLAVAAACSAQSQTLFSLQAYRDSVYLNSMDISNATVEVERATAQVHIAKTDFLPSLTASGSFTTDFRRSGDADLWGFTLQPRIEQILYAGGGVRATFRRAELQSDVATENQRMTQLDVRNAAERAYYSLSAMQLYRAATREYVAIIRSLYGVVEERFSEGYVAKGDLLQVETRLSEAEFALLEMENDYEVALHRFNALRGETGGGDVVLSNSILDSVAMPARVTVEQMLQQRPDMRAAMLSTLAAEYGVKATRSQYNPRLTAGVSGSWQTYSPNASAKTYVDGALVVGLSVPLFHWGERRSAVAVARSDVRRAENGMEQLRRDAAEQEADGWSAMTSSYSQIQSSLHNLAIAAENLSISTYSYQEGQATVLDVLQAQISWLQLYTNAITARFNYAVAVSDYHRITAQ